MLPNWPQWDAACDKQLEVHFTAGAFLAPILHPEHVPGVWFNILWIHWTFAVKDDETHKAQATIDGSKHAIPGYVKPSRLMHPALTSLQ